eukprot:gb/GFBE01057786.1/.p1 GENE.gb/GFBE01057786.1/~~gb/GFBE01057786.1/.p1  ORF type:complete len:125 (+),score=38.80 gb/GFBE01057786.1/:1-375(+)
MAQFRGSRLAVFAVLVCAGLSGMTFIAHNKGPALRSQEVRSSRVVMNFLGNDPPPQKEKEPEMGGAWGIIQGIDDYTKKGSASIKGPLAGVPWMTVVYFVIFIWLINLFISEGAKPDKPPITAS